MKLDLHVHTKYSFDCLCSPSKILQKAKDRGLDGIAITDHNNAEGWQNAIQAAKKLKMQLILGEEIKCKEGVELIGLFLKKEIKSDYYNQNSFAHILKEIKKQNGIAILAHPFEKKHSFEEIKNYAKKVDAIEILNSRRTRNKNKKAFLLYKKLKNKAASAGSDAHSLSEVGKAYTECEAKNLKEFKEGILKRRTIAKGKLSSRTVHLTSTFSSWIAFVLKKIFG